MSEALTIEQLYHECAKQMKAGNGKRRILLSGDDEGNSFHEQFFVFSKCRYAIGYERYMYPCRVTPQQADKEYIVLG
jgi:hypothetical protein